jgi:cytochrome c-type biogenesis protein CcmE
VKVKLILAALIVLAVAVWAASTFTKSLTSYVSFADARERGQRVQVMGEIQHELVEYDADSLLLNFSIVSDEGDRLQVSYDGQMPGNFGQATHAVVAGSYEEGVFRADQVMVKCPSKYQGQLVEKQGDS